MNKTPVYQYSFDYARTHDERTQYNASMSANIACKTAIEAAICEHYNDNCLNAVSAVNDVVRQFGYERTLYVLANTVQTLDHDGRISRQNKEWARTVPIPEDGRGYFMVTGSHPGLLNIFLNAARHEHLLTLPLKREDIKAEASKILKQFREASEPNSPNRTHFMAQISPDFWARAKQKDHDRLMDMLPFDSLSLSTLNGYKGIYALISKDEDRSKPLILRRPSVRKNCKSRPNCPSPLFRPSQKNRSGDMANRQRDVQLKFRVTPEERAMIEAKMDLLGTSNMAAYLRKMSIDGYAVNLDLPELRELVSLLRRTSNNLNQLTKRVHETSHFYDADLEDLQQNFDRLWNAAQKILLALSALH